MRLPRPRSLNGLILVGFGLVGLPLLLAVVWALVNLDRLAEQSEQLVVTGFTTAANNRQLARNVDSLERLARQYLVLRTPDSLSVLKQELESFEDTLDYIGPLAERAGAVALADGIRGPSLWPAALPPSRHETSGESLPCPHRVAPVAHRATGEP